MASQVSINGQTFTSDRDLTVISNENVTTVYEDGKLAKVYGDIGVFGEQDGPQDAPADRGPQDAPADQDEMPYVVAHLSETLTDESPGAAGKQHLVVEGDMLHHSAVHLRGVNKSLVVKGTVQPTAKVVVSGTSHRITLGRLAGNLTISGVGSVVNITTFADDAQLVVSGTGANIGVSEVEEGAQIDVSGVGNQIIIQEGSTTRLTRSGVGNVVQMGR